MKALFYKIFCLIALLGTFSCDKPVPQPTKPTVLVSIVPYGYFVQKIAQDAVNIEIFVPRGADPHTYEPTPKQVETAHKAALWLRIGEPFEDKVLKVLQKKSEPLKSLEMWQELPLLELEEGSHHCCGEEAQDRHVWLSPKLAKTQALRIKETLISLYPEKKSFFEENCSKFLQELEELDQKIAHNLSSLKDRAILVSHAAFGYFCRDYALRQLSIENEGKEVLPQKITSTLKETKKARVRCVIIQGQGNKGAQMIAKKLDLPVFLIDPYAWDYLENLKTLSEVISHASEK
jgi:zinc transport system substrate-binding protein